MNRIFFIVGLSYLVASFFIHFFSESLWIYLLVTLFILTIFSCFFKKIREEKVILISLITCTLAVTIHLLNFNFNISNLQKLDEKNAFISGKIIDTPYKKNNKYNYILKVESLNNKKVRPFKLKLSSITTLEAEAYDTFIGNVHFFLPQNDPSFNWKLYYKSNDIHILGYVYSYEPFQTIPQKGFNFHHSILKLRNKMLSLPKRIFSQQVGNVINGFLLGEKHSFPEDVKENFSNIGIYHLITTSAIHISILSQFFLWVLKKLKIGLKASSLIVSLIIILFMALTGFTPSVMRAGIISIIYNIGILFFRKPDSFNSLGISILLISVINPNAILNMGLWLSVFSYLGIIILQPKINYFICKNFKVNKTNKILNYFVSLISVSLAVAIFTFPLAALFLKKETLLFTISNILIIPISTLLLSLIVVLQACLLLKFPQFVTMPIGAVCGMLTNLIIDISSLLAKIPFSVISLNYLYVRICLAFSIFLIGISLLYKNYKKALKLSILISIFVFIAGTLVHFILTYNKTTVAVINCSDGFAVVITEKLRKSAIVFYEEKFNDTYLKEYFSRVPMLPCDYFNIISNENENNIASHFCKILSNSNLKNIAVNQKDVYNLWGHISIKTIRINKHVFVLIKVHEKNFLISCNGGDAQELPKEYKTCDFFIAGKLPLNYESIKADKIIISSNNKTSEILLNKLFEFNKKIFSTAHQGNIYIDINKNKCIIRRFE